MIWDKPFDDLLPTYGKSFSNFRQPCFPYQDFLWSKIDRYKEQRSRVAKEIRTGNALSNHQSRKVMQCLVSSLKK